jgi:Ca2+-binding EF-hand superfamily protein
MKLFKMSCDVSDSLECRYAIIGLDNLLEEVMLASRNIRATLWMGPNRITPQLLQQLQLCTGPGGAEVCIACVGVFRTLLHPDVIGHLTASPNNGIITECVRLLSHVDCGMTVASFLGECMSHSSVMTTLNELGVIDGFFSLFFKFKQSVNALSDMLGVYVGPFYSIFTLTTITECLNRLLQSQPAKSAAELFSPDHAANIKQLHGVICDELKSGRLVESDELHSMCDDLLLLLQAIVQVHVVTSSHYAETLQTEYAELVDVWAERLNASAVTGYLARVHTEVCVVGYPQWSSDKSFGVLKEDYALIVPHSVSLELLQNFYVALFQSNVVLNTRDDADSLTPLTTQFQLDALIRQSVLGTGEEAPDRNVVSVYLTRSEADQSSADVLGLMPKEVALRELQSYLALHSRRIHRQLMSDFYDLTQESKNLSEISMEQFVNALTGPKLQFLEQAAVDIFRAFDSDGNNTLSLKEIGLGFAMIADGSIDDRLQLMFQAYDTNRDNVLSKTELAYLVHAATGRTELACRSYADALCRRIDSNCDGVIDFEEFRIAVYDNQIPLGALWSEGAVRDTIDFAYSQPVPKVHKNSKTIPVVNSRDMANGDRQNYPRSRSMHIPREFMNKKPAFTGQQQQVKERRNTLPNHGRSPGQKGQDWQRQKQTTTSPTCANLPKQAPPRRQGGGKGRGGGNGRRK